MHKESSFGEKMGDWFRRVLSCCDREDDWEEERPALQISGPTNFRREDITIPGLDPEQQRFIREKAISDAQKMWTHLQPLRSSPSDHFASPDNTTTLLATHEDFTVPRSVSSTTNRRVSTGGGWDRVKAHSRKISNSLTKPLGYHVVHHDEANVVGMGGESRYEMRGLVDSSERMPGLGVDGKGSAGSFGAEGLNELGDRDGDSGKGMRRV